MKQHPIPQNILDIEFKLFTKFTVREFVYMALGIGFGGIFLYFFTKGQMPGIIAIPIFVVSSGVGLFLGLVPVNDQNADVFLRNYIWAITNPTQRVWKNEKLMDKEQITEKMEMTQGTLQRNPNQPGKPVIVGADGIGQNQFIEGSKIDEFDKEEAQRLASIGESATGTPEVKRESPPPPANTPEPIKEETVAPKTPQASPGAILISRETLSNFQTMPGNNGVSIGFQVLNSDGSPNKDAIVALKGNGGNVIFAQRTDSNGLVTLSKLLQADRYRLVVQNKEKTYSNIDIILDGKPLPIIKLKLG
ncbi:PrgI family protein [Candidatus Dojkabacteria bacterium]|nr:PrgI family protein [Candidatus Dojkabacteria bacterium]